MELADGSSSSSAVSGQTSLDTSDNSNAGSNSTADSSTGSHGVAVHGEIFATGQNIDTIARMSAKFGVEPHVIFDLEADLPPWLHGSEEHEIVFAEGVPSPVPPRRVAPEDSEDTYWIKVSSAPFLQKACQDANPEVKLMEGQITRYLHVHLLPTISLNDVNRIYSWSLETGMCEDVPIYITNSPQFNAKWESFRQARKLRTLLTQTKEGVRGYERDGIRMVGEREKLMNILRTKRAVETYSVAQYNAAKSAFLSAKDNQHQDMEDRRVEALAACSRMFAAKQAVTVVKEAVARLEYLAEAVEQNQLALEEGMMELTLMGCGVSLEEDANGAGAGDGGDAPADGPEHGGDAGAAPEDDPEHHGQ